VSIAPPPGEQLTEGVYDDGLEISNGGRNCNADGSFEIKDIDVAPDGAVNRLWILFKQRCTFSMGSLFGELRFGMAAEQPAATEPAAIDWPELELGAVGEPVPVAIRATGSSPVTVTGAALGGAAPEDFTVVQDECSGEQLAPGEFCDIWVAYAPKVAGERSATLNVSGSDGLYLEVMLHGLAHGGTTRAVFTSDFGELLANGGLFVYDPSNARILATGTDHSVRFRLRDHGGDTWSATFAAPAGHVLKAGATYEGLLTVQHYMNVCTGPGRFEVSEAAFAPSGELAHFGVGFKHYCADSDVPLRGTLEFRAPIGTAKLPGTDQPPTTPPAQPTPLPPLTRDKPLPSNAFVLGRIRAGRHGVSTYVVEVPGAGKLEIAASAEGKTIARLRRSVTRAGRYKAVLRPSRKGRALLHKKHRLRVQLRVTFTPTGGRPRTTKSKLVLRG
jgi:hypothetical protein